MKNLTIIHILLFLLLMVVYHCTSAQDFLVTTKGDTLRGKLKMLYGTEKRVQVIDSNKKKTVVSLFQTSSFLLDGETYNPVKGPTGYAFMKLLKSGYLSLYGYQLENQTLYDGRLLVKRDGTFKEVPNLGFKKVLKEYLGDCAEIQSKIEQGEYAKKDLEKLIDDYNACLDQKTEVLQQKVITNTTNVKKISAWEVLEGKVKTQPDFDGKNNALEMITEIKSKISKSEKVPNFLVDGLKSILQQPELQSELQAALQELQ